MRKTVIQLLTMLALMLVSVGVRAQDGSSPYLGSTHTYTVTMEDVANTDAWVLLDATATPLTAGVDYTISTAKDATNATATITFDKNIVVANYTLQFSETSGTSGCIALRAKAISVIANTFYVSTADQAATCNDSTGVVTTFGETGNTMAVIPANLNTTAWTPDDWNFTFTLGVVGGATITEVKVGQTYATSAAVTPVTGTYTAPNTIGTTATTYVYITLNGALDADQTVTLTLTGGTAIKGTATTPDNGAGTKTGAITINGLPNTSDITTD